MSMGDVSKIERLAVSTTDVVPQEAPTPPTSTSETPATPRPISENNALGQKLTNEAVPQKRRIRSSGRTSPQLLGKNWQKRTEVWPPVLQAALDEAATQPKAALRLLGHLKTFVRHGGSGDFHQTLASLGSNEQALYIYSAVEILGKNPQHVLAVDRLVGYLEGVAQVRAEDGQTLYLTRAQLERAEVLVRDFDAMGDIQKEKFRATLRSESRPMADALREAAEIVRQGGVKLDTRKVTPVKLEVLAEKLGWDRDGWQYQLLTSLDGAGVFVKDGEITAAELITGLRNPEDPTFATTTQIDRLLQLLKTKSGEEGAKKSIASLQEAWQRDLAKSADRNGDNTITAEEIKKFVEDPKSFHKLAVQNLSVVLHEIAQITGEADPFRIGGLDSNTFNVVRSSYAGVYDKDTMLAPVVAQVITAPDFATSGKIERENKFHADKELPKVLAAKPADYAKTGYDMGHLAPCADASNTDNMLASFSLLNMAPQTPELNRFSWRYLEAAVRDIVAATSGRAIVYTGTLFLDDKGQPMTKEDIATKVEHIGKEGRKIAVPTHCFKSIVLELPGGRMTTMSFVVPNSRDLPTDVPEIKKLLHQSRSSIAEIEKLSGLTFFDGFLPPGLEKSMKNSRDATPPGESKDLQDAGKFLWATARPRTWWTGPVRPFEVDALLEHLDRAMRSARQQKAAA